MPARGRSTSRGTGRSKPVGTVNPQPQSAQRKPGQAGFVQVLAQKKMMMRKRKMMTMKKVTKMTMMRLTFLTRVHVHEEDKPYKQENSHANRLLLRT